MQEQQQQSEVKVGIIRSWNVVRGYGVIQCGGYESLERYWLHVSKIRSGTAAPKRGMTVRFEVSACPVPDGHFPRAIKADVDVASLGEGREQ